MTEFGHLDEAEVDGDPLVVLSCGHTFLTSCMDRMLQLGGFYEAQGSVADDGYAPEGVTAWHKPKSLPMETTAAPTCPQCR